MSETVLALSWRGFDPPSTERCEIRTGRSSAVRSEVVRAGLRYRYGVEVGPDRVFRMLRVDVSDGTSLELVRGEDGGWRANGESRPDLADAVEIDLVISPVTNTLPLRRLAPAVGDSIDVVVAWVDADLTVSADPQRYTRLSERVYRFASLDGDFVRDITVDEHGFVVSYPGLYERVDEPSGATE